MVEATVSAVSERCKLPFLTFMSTKLPEFRKCLDCVRLEKKLYGLS